ncbi:hypothetical protein DIPPA_28553 [Diplonema papillatum]|nr:hypothetical protein DIPPA_28553 [Diplonema papillatum]
MRSSAHSYRMPEIPNHLLDEQQASSSTCLQLARLAILNESSGRSEKAHELLEKALAVVERGNHVNPVTAAYVLEQAALLQQPVDTALLSRAVASAERCDGKKAEDAVHLIKLHTRASRYNFTDVKLCTRSFQITADVCKQRHLDEKHAFRIIKGACHSVLVSLSLSPNSPDAEQRALEAFELASRSHHSFIAAVLYSSILVKLGKHRLALDVLSEAEKQLPSFECDAPSVQHSVRQKHVSLLIAAAQAAQADGDPGSAHAFVSRARAISGGEMPPGSPCCFQRALAAGAAASLQLLHEPLCSPLLFAFDAAQSILTDLYPSAHYERARIGLAQEGIVAMFDAKAAVVQQFCRTTLCTLRTGALASNQPCGGGVARIRDTTDVAVAVAKKRAKPPRSKRDACPNASPENGRSQSRSVSPEQNTGKARELRIHPSVADDTEPAVLRPPKAVDLQVPAALLVSPQRETLPSLPHGVPVAAARGEAGYTSQKKEKAAEADYSWWKNKTRMLQARLDIVEREAEQRSMHSEKQERAKEQQEFLATQLDLSRKLAKMKLAQKRDFVRATREDRRNNVRNAKFKLYHQKYVTCLLSIAELRV